ncbi:MAG: helix-turn-helix domain-containing protein, partial [Burkholderiaceae bacterium]
RRLDLGQQRLELLPQCRANFFVSSHASSNAFHPIGDDMVLLVALKAEISRIARKELRAETEAIRKLAATQRSEIAGLKRRVQELEKQLKAFSRTASRGSPKAASASSAEKEIAKSGLRFRAEGMASNRKRLGLSAADFGLLVGTSGQSVYAWEQGKSKPRCQNLAAIAALRGLGKREVAARLESLKQAEKPLPVLTGLAAAETRPGSSPLRPRLRPRRA